MLDDKQNNETIRNEQLHTTKAEYASATPAPTQLKHAGLGIASFTLGLIAILISILLTIYIFGSLASFLSNIDIDPSNLSQKDFMVMLETNPFLIATFPLFLVTGLLHVIGAILGLIGLFQDNRKKMISGIGLVLNALPILGFIILTLVGVLLSQMTI